MANAGKAIRQRVVIKGLNMKFPFARMGFGGLNNGLAIITDLEAELEFQWYRIRVQNVTTKFDCGSNSSRLK